MYNSAHTYKNITGSMFCAERMTSVMRLGNMYTYVLCVLIAWNVTFLMLHFLFLFKDFPKAFDIVHIPRCENSWVTEESPEEANCGSTSAERPQETDITNYAVLPVWPEDRAVDEFGHSRNIMPIYSAKAQVLYI